MRFAFPRLIALVTAMATLVLAVAPTAMAQSSGWQPGPGGILDNTYDGFVDSPTAGATIASGGSFTVSGWFLDKTAQGWAGADDIEVWLGTMDGGGKQLAKAVIAQNRPDVAAATGNPYSAASGFAATIPGSAVPAGSQTLYVYAHTGGKGWWWKSVTVTGGGSGTNTATAPTASSSSAPAAASTGAPTITFSNPTRGENVTTRKGDYTINGSVSNPSTVDSVEVWINGERGSDSGVLLGTTTPESDGSWSVVFRPTRFPSTHSNLYAYAHNRSGQLGVANVDINIVDK